MQIASNKKHVLEDSGVSLRAPCVKECQKRVRSFARRFDAAHASGASQRQSLGVLAKVPPHH
uniref:Uncharacterized protein n=1 Tax=uncultured alpha proteobacterium HF0010_30A23 TaxID=710802 RepID=E0XRN7_9PROT|nr:hypothetical protein [uncultured alpha proteobacterium HF0010_30A23]